MISIEHYIEIIKHHEKYRVSTNERNKFWQNLKRELENE